MRLLVMLLCAALTACTITVAPLKTTKKKNYRAKHSQSSKKKTKTTKSSGEMVKVDQAWMVKYKELEDKHQYWIDEDAEIRPDGDKFLVPKEVINHNTDMLKSKP